MKHFTFCSGYGTFSFYSGYVLYIAVFYQGRGQESNALLFEVVNLFDLFIIAV